MMINRSTIEKVRILIDTYDRAIADGWIHLRKSDNRHLKSTLEVLEALNREGEVIAISPEFARDFIKGVRFATSSPALAHP